MRSTSRKLPWNTALLAFLLCIETGYARSWADHYVCEIMLSGNGSRTEDQVYRLRLHKNMPHRSPEVVDLSEACLNEACPRPTGGFSHERIEVGTWSKYEDAVLDLQMGDTVVFGQEKYKLGEFLGAGNATHIYALADDPELVIRIPFVIPDLLFRRKFAESAAEAQLERSSVIRSFVEVFVKQMQKLEGATPLVKVDSLYRYVIAKRVHGDVTGLSFISQLMGPRKITTGEMIFYPSSRWDLSRMTSSERERLDALLELAKANRHATAISSGVIAVNTGQVRQYLFDEKTQKWAVVDAE